MSLPLQNPNLNNTCYYSNSSGIIISSEPVCKPGFYCPLVDKSNPSTLPRMCPESAECRFMRLIGNLCIDGYKGAQGKYEPIICSKGFYCPTPQEMKSCPKRYYCPAGTFNPRKCDYFSFCPEGSAKQQSLTGIVAFLLADFILAFIFILRYVYERRRSIKLVNQVSVWTLDDDETKDQLANSFLKSMGGKALKMHFKMENLVLTLPSGKTVLNGVTGEIKSGRMTAIMGPSGAGKTTFMNVLSGKVTGSTGTLWINSKKVELSQFKKISGFVPQEDIMHTELSVRENILHSARMRLPDIWTTAEIDKHLDTVLKALDLSHIEHTIIGDENTRGVSGGQRKRVNIGMEIAAMPLCLCLDEPTSGLDSTAALEVADILRRMSELGMTVLAVIHQPRVEIFHKFDDVLLLAPGGRTAYLGPTKGTKPYFEGLGFKFAEGSNVADVLMDILSGVGVNTINPMNINQLVEEWAKKCLHESIEELDTKIDDEIFHSTVGDLISARGASFWKQLIYVHNLSLLQQFRKWPGLALEVFVGMLAGAIIGISVANLKEVFAGVWAYPYTLLSSAPIPDVIVQFILFTGMAVSMAAAPAGVKVYSEELTVYWRNAASGHSKLAYYIGKFFSSIYRMILASVHFTAVLFFFSGVSTFVNQFFMVTFFFFGVYGVSNFVSMVVRRENATLLAVIITLFASVFCGYGLTIKDAKSSNIYFFWTTQFNMWGGEAFYWQAVSIYEEVYDLNITNEFYGYTFSRVGFDYAMMFIIGVVWRIFGFLAMVGLNREKQR